MNKKQRIAYAVQGLPVDRVPTSWYTHFPDQRDNTVSDQIAWAKAADMDMLCVETDGYMQFDCGNTDLSSPAALRALRPHKAGDPYIAGQVDRARRIAEGLKDDAAVTYMLFTPYSTIKHSTGSEWLLRSYSGTAKNDHYVNNQLGCIAPAIAYIAENYMEEVSIEKLSHLCHVSTSHFRRLFKQVLGWVPLDYVQMVRIDRVCVLLYNCNHSVTEIGLQVGYPSPSSFNRQFRRIHGISPSHWRQKMRSEENSMVTAYFNSLPPSNSPFFPN